MGLLQDLSQLTAELSQHLDDHEVSYYKQWPAPLWNDWEKLKAILCEVIDAYHSKAHIGVPEVGTSNSHHSTVGVDLVILTVLDITERRRIDYRGAIQQISSLATFNWGSNRCQYESCDKILLNENKSMEPNVDSYSVFFSSGVASGDASQPDPSVSCFPQPGILLHSESFFLFSVGCKAFSFIAAVF
jgi:hypothetical protein